MTGDLDSRPPRPFLPPLLVAGLVLWAATALIWPTLRLAPTAAFPVLGMLALGAAVWLASHALRAARGDGFSLGALAALSSPLPWLFAPFGAALFAALWPTQRRREAIRRR